VPGAAQALDNLKMEVAQELGYGQLTNTKNYGQALDSWKYEVAGEIGILGKIQQVGWANMTSRECGRVGGRMGGKLGGNMVKRMIEYAESTMR